MSDTSAPNVESTAPESTEASPEVGASEETTLETTQGSSQSTPEAQGDLAKDALATKKEEKKQEEVAKKIRKLKLKVDGKEFDEELPFDIDDKPEIVEYLKKELQLARMGQKRASEASDYKKQLDSVGKFLSEAKENPLKMRELMKELGADEKALAAAIIEEEIERSKKSPEQLEREKMEAELRSLKEERENEKKDYEAREFERLQQQESQRYDTMISSALEKSDLPKSPYVVKKVAEYMLMGLQQGMDVTAEDIIPLVREEVQGDIRQMFSVMPEEMIEQVIGKDTLKRLRTRNIAKATPAVPVSKSIVDSGSKGESVPGKKISFKDYFKI